MATNQKFLSLNWQDFFDNLFSREYPVSVYDIVGDNDSIIINEKNKEKFLNEMSQYFRQVIETSLEEVDDETETENKNENENKEELE